MLCFVAFCSVVVLLLLCFVLCYVVVYRAVWSKIVYFCNVYYYFLLCCVVSLRFFCLCSFVL